ncbi:MAG: hypothetical protein JJ926_18480, partial [Roseitalea sp.]|nr:hypothetical protein [Roseitalea sp.]
QNSMASKSCASGRRAPTILRTCGSLTRSSRGRLRTTDACATRCAIFSARCMALRRRKRFFQ